MNKKERKRFTVNIPQYMWELINKIHEESPSITENGTMLTILEKGINWYQKKWKQEEKKAETVTPGNESARPDQHQDLPQSDASVDHENIINEIKSKAIEILKQAINGDSAAIAYISSQRIQGTINAEEEHMLKQQIYARIRIYS